MKITDVSAKTFVYKTNQMKDSDGHSHPGPWRDSKMSLFTITCDDGTQGHTIVSPRDARKELLDSYVKPVLIGADPMRTEQLWYSLYKWQRGSGFALDDRTL